MIERLAIASWNARPVTLEDWTKTLADLGHEPQLKHWDDLTWIYLKSPGLRGLVVIEGDHVEAIDFEIFDKEIVPTLAFLEAAAASLGWEIHEADDEDDES